MELTEACLDGNEEAAGTLADVIGGEAGGLANPATKAAIAYYTQTQGRRVHRSGIRLNAVAPGVIDTPMSRTNKDDPTAGDAAESYLAAVPAGRAGRPEEVTSAITYLLGPESSYTVGSVLFVDGGTDAKCRGMDWPRVWAPESSGSTAIDSSASRSRACSSIISAHRWQRSRPPRRRERQE
ncbi:SDR family NAD(P)-dependent oxidoreductase [Rhodococcus sp. NPDC003322]